MWDDPNIAWDDRFWTWDGRHIPRDDEVAGAEDDDPELLLAAFLAVLEQAASIGA